MNIRHLAAAQYQDSLTRAVSTLEHFFLQASEAEEKQDYAGLAAYSYQCQRWSVISALILAAGVNPDFKNAHN